MSSTATANCTMRTAVPVQCSATSCQEVCYCPVPVPRQVQIGKYWRKVRQTWSPTRTVNFELKAGAAEVVVLSNSSPPAICDQRPVACDVLVQCSPVLQSNATCTAVFKLCFQKGAKCSWRKDEVPQAVEPTIVGE